MPIPDYFYFQLSQSAKKFQKEFSGNADFSRLINGYSNFWISPQNGNQLQPKKIILTPSVLFDYSNSYLTCLRQFLDHLSHLKFQFFIETEQNIYELAPINFDDYVDGVFASSEAVLTQFNKEKTLYLDLFDIQRCFQEIMDKKPEFVFKRSYLRHNEISTTLIKKFLDKQIPYFIDMPVMLDAFCLNRKYEKLFFEMTKEIQTKLAFFYLNQDKIEDFNTLDTTDLHSLKCIGLTIDEKIKHKISSLDIHTIKLENCEVDNYLFLPTTIKHLTLENIHITESNLIQLLKHISNLKSFSLSRFTVTEKTTTQLRFSNIRKLNIQGEFSYFSEWFPNVRILDIYSDDDVNQNINFPDIVMVNGFDLFLIPFINQHPWVQRKNLEINPTQLEELTGSFPNFFNLELIECENLIGFETYRQLSVKFPNVKCLHLAITSFEVINDDLYFYNLEELYLGVDSTEFETTPEALHKLINSCPKLNSLNLLNCSPEVLSDCFWSTCDLMKFKSLLIDQIFLDDDFFSNFFAQIQNLNKLELEQNTIEFYEMSFDDLPVYPQVKHLSLRNVTLNLSDLVYLLTVFNQLQMLEIETCYLEIDDIQSFFTLLPNLKQIKVDSNMPQEVIALLLDSAPNLNEESKAQLAIHFRGAPKMESLIFDADTTFKKGLSYSVKKIFTCVNQSSVLIPAYKYRLQLFGNLKPSEEICSINKAFTISNHLPDSFITIEIPKKTDKDNTLFKIQISTVLYEAIKQLRARRETISFDTLFEDTTPSDEFDLFLDQIDSELALCSLEELQNLEKQQRGLYVVGNYSIMSDDEWHALPSLMAYEELLCYETSYPENLEFKYSTRDNLYYVKTNCTYTQITFYLFVPNIIRSQTIAAELQPAINFYKAFKKDELCLEPERSYTGQELLTLLNEQTVGSCRHRAILFKNFIDTHYPQMYCRVVTNHVHAFIELYCDNQWNRIDLGGYPAQINYIESQMPSNSGPRLKLKPKKQTDTEHSDNYDISEEDSDDELDLSDDIQQFSSQLSQLRASDKKISLDELIGSICETQQVNRLIECQTQEELQCLQYNLQRSLNDKLPTYYVHKPDELHCMGPSFILLDDDSVEIQAHQHPLYRFLSENASGCLIINYTHFSSEEYVAYNDMLDNTRALHGLVIPRKIRIIGLRLESDFTPEQDFYSRFNIIQSFPLVTADPVEFPFQTTDEELESKEMMNQPYVIQLFNSQDWESFLLGKFIPSNKGWRFHKGQLIRALESGACHIIIQNGPWENEDFCHFWRQAAVQGFVNYASKRLTLPENVIISTRNGYDATPFAFYLSEVESNYYILNPSSFNFFFQNVDVIDGALSLTDGYLDQADTDISILISAPISIEQWAQLVSHIKEKNLKLNLKIAPGVAKNTLSFIPPETAETQLTLRNTRLIQTNDSDGLLFEYKDDFIIDISECAAYDLIDSIDISPANPGFSFTKKPGFIKQTLASGKRIVLKGALSEQFVAELTPLLLEDLDGLILITEDPQPLSFLHFESQLVNRQDYITTQYGTGAWLESASEHDSIAQLAARYHYWQRTHDCETKQAWQGMLYLDPSHKNPSQDEIAIEAFYAQRQDMIRSVLATQPYVYIAGISGVGKSTFVSQQFIQKGEALFIGDTKENMLRWIESKAELNVLFIDEVNLSPSHFSLFEGLFLSKPALFYDGQYHKLSSKHKVIFAGNPLNYGDERRFANFFYRHGNAIVFNPLPLAVVKTEILAPILYKRTELIESILTIYTRLCELSKHTLLISPRELKALAIMTRHTLDSEFGQYSDETIFQYNVYYMSQQLLDISTFVTYCEKYNVTKPPQRPELVAPGEDHRHLFLSSRQPVITLLIQQLALHQSRVKGLYPNDSGLGGVLIEGDVGLGKSELVSSCFERLNISFVRISASSSIAEKERLLLQAFHEGQVAWIDELNSSPVLESLLNALLMGRTQRGDPPRKTGFMLVVTQNPSSMAGRRELSPALLRRLMILKVNEYTRDEMITIFKHKGMKENQATALAIAYQIQKQESKLSFRDALKLVPKERIAAPKRNRETMLGSSTAGFYGHGRKEARLDDSSWHSNTMR